MNTRTRSYPALLLAVGLSVAVPVQAALHDRGGGLIYDDVLDVTWLQDANYGAGSSYDDGGSATDGRMTWANAVAWAASLSYYDSVRDVTYDDWRLPTMIDTGTPGCNSGYSGTDCGYNVQTFSAGTTYSELAYMYYVNLGNKGRYDPSGSEQSGYGMVDDPLNANDESLFTNLGSNLYSSGLEYAPNTSYAWFFYTYDGVQTSNSKIIGTYFAWAVRDGDVAAVPEPGTYAMLLAGLGLVGMMARRATRQADRLQDAA